MKKAVHRLEHESMMNGFAPPAMASAARHFAETQLTQDGLSCYWLKALTLYATLFYAAGVDDIPENPTF